MNSLDLLKSRDVSTNEVQNSLDAKFDRKNDSRSADNKDLVLVRNQGSTANLEE
jgi:hypothetical protein